MNVDLDSSDSLDCFSQLSPQSSKLGVQPEGAHGKQKSVRTSNRVLRFGALPERDEVTSTESAADPKPKPRRLGLKMKSKNGDKPSMTDGDLLGVDEEGRSGLKLGKKITKLYKKMTDDSGEGDEDAPRSMLARRRINVDSRNASSTQSSSFLDAIEPRWQEEARRQSPKDAERSNAKVDEAERNNERLGERPKASGSGLSLPTSPDPPRGTGRVARLSGVVSPRTSGPVKTCSSSVIFKQLSPDIAVPLSPRGGKNIMLFSSTDKGPDHSDGLHAASSPGSSPPASLLLKPGRLDESDNPRQSMSSIRSSGNVAYERGSVRMEKGKKTTFSFLATSPTLSPYGSHLTDEALATEEDSLRQSRSDITHVRRTSMRGPGSGSVDEFLRDDDYVDFAERKKYGVMKRVRSRLKP